MITQKDIDNLANLARLELSPEEKAGFLNDLNRILGYVGEVQKIGEISSTTTHDRHTVNTMREDLVTTETASYTESLVSAAPERDNNLIKVKKILS